MAKEFATKELEDFTITDGLGGAVIGHLRIQPHAISWRPKGKQKWMKVTIEQFATFAEENGKLTKK